MPPETWSNTQMYFVDLPLLVVLVSLVYSATRYESWRCILLESLRWMGQLGLFLGGIGLLLYLTTKV
ncbi:MAG: hypothetical protein SNJ75_15035 [Gemmataceae bacterium]